MNDNYPIADLDRFMDITAGSSTVILFRRLQTSYVWFDKDNRGLIRTITDEVDYAVRKMFAVDEDSGILSNYHVITRIYYIDKLLKAADE